MKKKASTPKGKLEPDISQQREAYLANFKKAYASFKNEFRQQQQEDSKLLQKALDDPNSLSRDERAKLTGNYAPDQQAQKEADERRVQQQTEWWKQIYEARKHATEDIAHRKEIIEKNKQLNTEYKINFSDCMDSYRKNFTDKEARGERVLQESEVNIWDAENPLHFLWHVGLGNKVALSGLGRIYEKGYGVKKNQGLANLAYATDIKFKGTDYSKIAVKVSSNIADDCKTQILKNANDVKIMKENGHTPTYAEVIALTKCFDKVVKHNTGLSYCDNILDSTIRDLVDYVELVGDTPIGES